jgi:hypothetical protein
MIIMIQVIRFKKKQIHLQRLSIILKNNMDPQNSMCTNPSNVWEHC